MSIPILDQTYDETRRLAIAGGSVASGDFRLKKLVPALKSAGEKAPVFAKIAQAAQAVVDSNEKTASAALLDLSSIISAVLYTQGTTGAAGELQPVETVEFQVGPTQASARMLKPLLEALKTTGSGRLETIKDAVERGTFADLRLVYPALGALDDVYLEIAELIQNRVLPLYGQAIVPELRNRLDIKRGRAGDVRRLLLLYQLDPAGTRSLVKQALDEGSKEIRAAAIECLGDTEEDVAFLLEQSKAKAKDVRTAALSAMSRINSKATIDVVKKAALKSDLGSLVPSLKTTESTELQSFVIEETEKQLAETIATKDEKLRGPAVARLCEWLGCLEGRTDADAVRVVGTCFEKAEALAKIKSTPGGTDANEYVTFLMARGDRSLRERLIANQENLSGPSLENTFIAARRELDPKRLFEIFSPAMKPVTVNKRTKSGTEASERRATIRQSLVQVGFTTHHAWRMSLSNWAFRHDPEPLPVLDPRWLDVAIESEDLDLVCHLARPGHAATIKFLLSQYESLRKKDPHSILQALVRAEYSEAVTLIIENLKASSKPGAATSYFGYWIAHLIPDLPVSAIEPLEAALPTFDDKLIDRLIGPIQQLKAKAGG